MDATPQHDVDTQPMQGVLHCESPSAMGRTNRTETCRLLADFAKATAFTPPASADQLWFGIAFSATPGTEIEEAAERTFLVLDLRAAPPPADVVERAHLPASALLPVAARELFMTRFGHPTSSVRGALRERADFERFSAIIAQHSEGVAPELVAELRAMKPVSPDLAVVDAAIWRTTGPSLWLHGRLTGGDWYIRIDGTRLVLANPPMAAELWPVR